ncbi:hypothetical protein D5086_003457 [Populus alba]|uniref:Uncharacterized protein n=1 Tax=Populus alba TaxID=43335 RepID=A0ACC4D4C3_POPAL
MAMEEELDSFNLIGFRASLEHIAGHAVALRVQRSQFRFFQFNFLLLLGLSFMISDCCVTYFLWNLLGSASAASTALALAIVLSCWHLHDYGGDIAAKTN